MKVILIALVFNFLISCWPKVDIINCNYVFKDLLPQNEIFVFTVMFTTLSKHNIYGPFLIS